MKVLYVSAELFPLLKTGGLADVSAALPPALALQGADVRVLLPAFAAIQAGVTPIGAPMPVPVGRPAASADQGDAPPWLNLPAGLGPQAHTTQGPLPWLQAGRLSDTGLPVLLLHAPGLYEQGAHPYHDDQGQPWTNSAERFAWLGWAAALLGMGLDPTWQPDVVHGHDWHTGLAFAYLHQLKACADGQSPALRTNSVFTIHNLAYQGVFGQAVRTPLGLPDALFHMQGLEFHGNVSFMKAGLRYSDAITTVSPSYAREITRPEQGCGLDGVLRQRQAVLHGILNGVDATVWNPASDPLVQPGYSASQMRGKSQAKARLQRQLGLMVNAKALLCCVVSRLTHQKGLDLIPQVLDDLVARGGQLAVLGAGDAAIEQALQDGQQRHPHRVALRVGYDEALAHQLMAGADVILVPSLFEPCGLTQLYGLRYGTLPLVRAVGGLADTVTDCSLENLDDGSASGFVFQDFSAQGLDGALRRAFALHRRPRDWAAVQRHAMGQRFDWASAARAYMAVYAAPSPGTATA
jgi:starch synthase